MNNKAKNSDANTIVVKELFPEVEEDLPNKFKQTKN